MSRIYRRGFADFLGKKTLIFGEIRSGKTRMTSFLLCEALFLGFAEETTVIDMAPRTKIVNGMRIGGRLLQTSKRQANLKYFTPKRVVTPRLSAKNGKELLTLVEENRKNIYPLLRSYIDNPSPIMFVNDISIYLQSGDIDTLTEALEKANTFIGNGYYGNTLKRDFSTGISSREKRLMETLAETVDIRLKLSNNSRDNLKLSRNTHSRINKNISKQSENVDKTTLAEALISELKTNRGAISTTSKKYIIGS